MPHSLPALAAGIVPGISVSQSPFVAHGAVVTSGRLLKQELCYQQPLDSVPKLGLLVRNSNGQQASPGLEDETIHKQQPGKKLGKAEEPSGVQLQPASLSPSALLLACLF